MKALFEYIKARLNARVPAIKTVRMSNDQIEGSNTKRYEKPFKYPACFITFNVNGVENKCLGIRDIDLTVRFTFAKESYKFERLETFDFCDAFIEAIQLMAPTEASGLTFTTFQEVLTDFDENFNNVEKPFIDYKTIYRSLAGYSRKTDEFREDVTTEISGTIDSLESI